MCSRSREVRSRSRTSSSVSRDVISVSEPSAVRTPSVLPPLRAPALTEVFRALLEADFTVQLRNNRVLLLVAADLFEGVSLIAEAYLLTFICVIFSSALFLGVGQALAGLIKSADTLNAVGRIAYLPLFALGLFAHSTIFGTTFELISRWSPGGTVETLLSGAMNPSSWNSDTWLALAVSTAYSVVFAGIGIRWVQWGGR